MTPPPSPGTNDLTSVREMEDRMRARFRAMEEDAGRLRTQVRVLGLALGATLCLLALFFFVPGFAGSLPQSDVLEAQGFRLVDADGLVRGEWGVDEEGAARLSLLDERRQPRLNMTVLRSGYPGVALINGAGQRRAVLGLLPDRTTTLVFADGAGVPRAVLGLTRADEANLVFADSEGVTRMGMGLAGDGIGSVMMPQDTLPAPAGAQPDGEEDGDTP